MFGKRIARTKRGLAALVAAGMMFQFGGCDLGEISVTSTTTMDGRTIITSLLRSAIVTPFDNFVTDRVNDFFDEMED